MTGSGRRNYKGVVTQVENDLVVVEIDGDLHELHLSDIESANLVTATGKKSG